MLHEETKLFLSWLYEQIRLVQLFLYKNRLAIAFVWVSYDTGRVSYAGSIVMQIGICYGR